MAQALAAKGVPGLDGNCVERPEVYLGDAQQRSPAEPANQGYAEQDKRGPHSGQCCDLTRHLGQPGGCDQRSEAEQDPGYQDQRDPRERQLRQADLGKQAAGDRNERALLRARGVVLGIALARIDEQGRKRRCGVSRPGSRIRFHHGDRPVTSEMPPGPYQSPARRPPGTAPEIYSAYERAI